MILLPALLVLAAGCCDEADDRDYSALHAAGLIDLDGDSDNDNGFDLPARSAYEDSIEDVFGARDKTVVVPLHSSNSDAGDVSGIDTNSTAAECFVPLVLELAAGVDVSTVTIQICHGPVHDDAGNVRLWLKPSHEPRNPAAVIDGGDLLPASATYTCGALGITADKRTAVLYAEGTAASTEWGDVRVSVLLDPDGDGPGDFAAADFVRLSVIDATWTVYLVLPYTFERINDVETRTFAHIDFSSPGAYIASFARGLQLDDPLSTESGWHGGVGSGYLSANIYGHSFTHLRYVGPGAEIDTYYGKTDIFDASGILKVRGEILSGNLHWANETGRRNNREELLQWVNNTHLISSVRGGPANLPLVLHHKWTLSSLRAIDRVYALSEPRSRENPDGTDYGNFGYDIYTTGGGCTYVSGAVMERVAREIGGFGEQAAWRSSLIWPIIPSNADSLSETAAAYNADPRSRSWGREEIDGQYRRATYFDTGLMGDWMIAHPGESVFAMKAGTE